MTVYIAGAAGSYGTFSNQDIISKGGAGGTVRLVILFKFLLLLLLQVLLNLILMFLLLF